ncbi:MULTISPECIES: DUF664 domain-containing protein [Nonomuraea]|uniref:DUF664 domain-containing protein n=1 Tax=Nonomuraea ferruginea TaxID=46174 RepID=A0ABT4T625_9ACTN|nr:DUF664 domain-containing protein [Nonomuraea ferruginea]MDA0644949.1 DUF664 domain-containing protein [Nonomuraea ferruginea]
MSMSRERPPFVADERTQLVGWLDMQRAIVQWKCAGLSEEDADMRIDGVPLAKLLDEYECQCRISNEIVAAHSLDDVGKHPDYRSGAASLRWMLIHMVEETARHAGHLDTIRELVDGEKGYY